MPAARFSVERLVHFQCEVCDRWWSIGDAPERDHWFCPWCGARLETGPPLPPLAAPEPSADPADPA